MVEDKQNIVELRPGIYQIRAERPGCHVYLIKGRSKNVLIDTGLARSFPYLEASLGRLGLLPSDIHLILLTHEHFDHVGATALSFDHAIIAAHRLAANKIQLQDEFVMMNKYFHAKARPFQAHIWLEDNTMIDLGNYRLQTIHTPGHCSGCISLYEPDHKLLFTGDTVLGGGLLSDVCPSGSISDYVNALERLSCLHVAAFYPGHGRISNQPADDLGKALNAARNLLAESKALFEALDTKSIFGRLFMAARRFPRAQRSEGGGEKP